MRRRLGREVIVNEASSEETPYGRYITSEGWFVLNLEDALAVRNDEKGGAVYPLESREAPFGDFGVNVRVLWPREPNALYHSEAVQEGFLVLSGQCTLIVEHEGKVEVVVSATNLIRSYDLATGAQLWECGGMTANAIPSPARAA